MEMRQAVSCVLFWFVFLMGISTGKEVPSEWIHRAWQTEDGLPDNSVTGLAQTQDGYIWVGTRGGLLRFNGSAFTAIPLPFKPEISHRVVGAVIMGQQDRLWMGMERGEVACLESGKMRIFGHDHGLPDLPILSLGVLGHG